MELTGTGERNLQGLAFVNGKVTFHHIHLLSQP
jgi:hypothetical protein